MVFSVNHGEIQMLTSISKNDWTYLILNKKSGKISFKNIFDSICFDLYHDKFEYKTDHTSNWIG